MWPLPRCAGQLLRQRSSTGSAAAMRSACSAALCSCTCRCSCPQEVHTLSGLVCAAGAAQQRGMAAVGGE